MARDRAKNAYFTVGIPLDSETLLALKADSAETGVSIPQLLAVRITDWYAIASGHGPAPPAHAAKLTEGLLEQVQDQVGANGHGLQLRASAAAVAWGVGEDE